uniref:Predicted gene, 17359 n=1 Tax=Jaculus jaculus TaxID=51337 RepID=A0A8C5P4E3_JACJA
PDYIKDHLPKLHQHTAYIGEKRPALEKTGDLKYLWRPASNRSMPAKYKYQHVGEVGWGIPEYNFINKSRLESGFHIKHGELSVDAIDKLTHRYQNPWQPKPSVLDRAGRYSRAFLAWHMDDYEGTHQRNSRRALLVKESKSPNIHQQARLPKLQSKDKGWRYSSVVKALACKA